MVRQVLLIEYLSQGQCRCFKNGRNYSKTMTTWFARAVDRNVVLSCPERPPHVASRVMTRYLASVETCLIYWQSFCMTLIAK